MSLTQDQKQQISSFREEIKLLEAKILQIYQTATLRKFQVSDGQTIRISTNLGHELATVLGWDNSSGDDLHLEVQTYTQSGKPRHHPLVLDDPNRIVEKI